MIDKRHQLRASYLFLRRAMRSETNGVVKAIAGLVIEIMRNLHADSSDPNLWGSLKDSYATLERARGNRAPFTKK